MRSYDVELTKDDHLAAHRLHCRGWSRFAWGMVGLLVLAGIASLLLLEGETVRPAAALAFGSLGGLLFMIGWRAVFFRRGVNRIYDQSKRFMTTRWEWGEQGLGVAGLEPIPWNEFIKTREDDRTFLIYNTDISFCVFPKKDNDSALMIEDIKKHFLNARQKTI